MYTSILFELCVREKKKEKRKKEREKRPKSKFSHAIFSTVRRINGTLGVYIYLRMAKGFHL